MLPRYCDFDCVSLCYNSLFELTVDHARAPGIEHSPLNDFVLGTWFLSRLLASLIRNCFPKRTSGVPLHTLSKLYDVPVGFEASPLHLRQYITLFAVARYLMMSDFTWN